MHVSFSSKLGVSAVLRWHINNIFISSSGFNKDLYSHMHIYSYRWSLSSFNTIFHIPWKCWCNPAEVIGELTEWVRHYSIICHSLSMEEKKFGDSIYQNCQTSYRPCWVAWLLCRWEQHTSPSCCRNGNYIGWTVFLL